MKGAFDAPAIIVISMMCVLVMIITLFLTISLGWLNPDGSYSANADLRGVAEQSKTQYRAHMAAAAITNNQTWTNKTGYYDLKSISQSYITGEIEDMLGAGYSLSVYRDGENVIDAGAGGTLNIPDDPDSDSDCPSIFNYYETSTAASFCSVPKEGEPCPYYAEPGTLDPSVCVVTVSEIDLESADLVRSASFYVASPSTDGVYTTLGVTGR